MQKILVPTSLKGEELVTMCKTLKECLEYKKVIIYISYYFAGKKKTKAQKLNNKPKDI